MNISVGLTLWCFYGNLAGNSINWVEINSGYRDLRITRFRLTIFC